MLLIESLAGALRTDSNRRNGNFYFVEGAIPDWGKAWLNNFPASIWAQQRGTQTSFDCLATRLESPVPQALNRTTVKMAFLLEMAALFGGNQEAPDTEHNTDPLRGILHFLLATEGPNRPRTWPGYELPNNTQRSKSAHRFIKTDLAELYLRLLVACLYWAGGGKITLPAELPELDLGGDSRFAEGYEKKRIPLTWALIGMRLSLGSVRSVCSVSSGCFFHRHDVLPTKLICLGAFHEVRWRHFSLSG